MTATQKYTSHPVTADSASDGTSSVMLIFAPVWPTTVRTEESTRMEGWNRISKYSVMLMIVSRRKMGMKTMALRLSMTGGKMPSHIYDQSVA
jgi:hypothetical protein